MVMGETRFMARLRVRELAEAQGLNAPQLSHAARVAQTVIWEIWNNPERNVRSDILLRIANALKVSLDDLFEKESLKPSDSEKN